MKRAVWIGTILLCLTVLLAGCCAPAADITPPDAGEVPAGPVSWGNAALLEAKASVPEVLYPGSITDPQEAMEKLQPAPQTAVCPVCGGMDLSVELADQTALSGGSEAVQCIHHTAGQDESTAILMQVQDVCQRCTDPAHPWTGEAYEIEIGRRLKCHGW